MILPYVDPVLPDWAPGWTREWCSSRRTLDRRLYDATVKLFEFARQNEQEEAALLLAEQFPIKSLCFMKCKQECKFCHGVGHYGVTFGVSPIPSPRIVLCVTPDACDEPIWDHPVLPAEDITILGYRDGITPRVMRAMYDRRPYEFVRRIAADPSAELH